MFAENTDMWSNLGISIDILQTNVYSFLHLASCIHLVQMDRLQHSPFDLLSSFYKNSFPKQFTLKKAEHKTNGTQFCLSLVQTCV